ncbi:hypothetical protein HK104_002501 [Borealophlyctis nickersoniae]|nr:hypothetical protein HK104_002501 [Borealophlyctis nickersoniae]
MFGIAWVTLALALAERTIRAHPENPRAGLKVIKPSLQLIVSQWFGWSIIAVTLWQGGRANASSADIKQQMLTVAIASVGYPIVKIVCIKALEPAWRGRVPGVGLEALQAVEKDMSFTIAYESFFGVAGRIVVLRQPSFAAFILSLLGSGAFDFGMRMRDALRFRSRMMEKMESAEECVKEKAGLDNMGDEMEQGVRDVIVRDVGDCGKSPVDSPRPTVTDFVSPPVLGGDDPPLPSTPPAPHSVPNPTLFSNPLSDPQTVLRNQHALHLPPVSGSNGALPDASPEVGGFLAASIGVLSSSKASSFLSLSIRPSLPADDILAEVEKTPQDTPSSSSIPKPVEEVNDETPRPPEPDATPLHVLIKSWGAHQLAMSAADFLFRLVAFSVLFTFISLSPENRHACFGFVAPREVLTRSACSTVFVVLSNTAALAAEERITGVRYKEVMTWIPKFPWYSFAMIIMLAVSGGIGPMLAVDAGLFGPNGCFPDT